MVPKWCRSSSIQSVICCFTFDPAESQGEKSSLKHITSKNVCAHNMYVCRYIYIYKTVPPPPVEWLWAGLVGGWLRVGAVG